MALPFKMFLKQSHVSLVVVILIFCTKSATTFDVNGNDVLGETPDKDYQDTNNFADSDAESEFFGNRFVETSPTTVPSTRSTVYSNSSMKLQKKMNTSVPKALRPVVVVVACETKFNQTLNLIKSALIFTKTELNFIIFTDEYVEQLTTELSFWKETIQENKFEFTVMNMGPLEINPAYLSEKFRKCGAQKVFLPSLLNTTDLVLYVESDSVFLGPVEELWSIFDKFNKSQMAAMSRDPKVDASSILMNLKKMRQFGWPHFIAQIIPKWKLHVDLSGQDIMDIIFNHHKHTVLDLPCVYNYQTSLCLSKDVCPEARSKGVLLLHSSYRSETAESSEEQIFNTIYENLSDFEIGMQSKTEFSNILNRSLSVMRNSSDSCATEIDAFLKLPNRTHPVVKKRNPGKRIVIAVIGCGNLRRPLNVIKSALIFTKSPLYFVIFIEDAYKKKIIKMLLRWKVRTYNQFEFEVFSNNNLYLEEYKGVWMNLYKECALQKLFFPMLLPHIDSLIYIDEDALFLGPADEMWSMFNKFDLHTIAAMAEDHYIPEFAFYPFSKQTPYYQATGLNSGVMLMNLTRMRNFNWHDRVRNTYKEWKNNLILGDQDVLNIIFNESSEAVMVLPCRFNYRSYLCEKEENRTMLSKVCEDVIISGVNLLLDVSFNLETLKGSVFLVLYRAIDEFAIGEDPRILPVIIKWYLKNKPPSLCGDVIESSVNSINQTVFYNSPAADFYSIMKFRASMTAPLSGETQKMIKKHISTDRQASNPTTIFKDRKDPKDNFLTSDLGSITRKVIDSNDDMFVSNTSTPAVPTKRSQIIISFVVCDSRLAEAMNLAKSALLFTSYPLHFVIFAEDNLKHLIINTMSKWKTLNDIVLSFEIHDINFPEQSKAEWMELFSKCSAQRLFIPKLLPHIDSLIYIDTDSVFLGPVEEIWEYFTQFNKHQMIGMVLEHERADMSWYPRFAKHPFYGKFGVNSGLMLMNLTRLREFGWTDYVTYILPKWKLYIPWGDQDIINIVFNEHPKGVLELPCRYNYRTDHCTYGDLCSSSAAGVFLVHGNRGVFHRDNKHTFAAIYKAMSEYELGTDKRLFLAKMKLYLEEVPMAPCKDVSSLFLKVPSKLFTDSYVRSALIH